MSLTTPPWAIALPVAAAVVDDEAEARKALRRSLRKHAMDVIEARNVAETLKLLQARRVEVVLLDLHLGDSCGLDVIDPIRAADPDVSVFSISGVFTELEHAAFAQAAGAIRHFNKPVDLAELLQAIWIAVLGRRNAPTMIGRGVLRLRLDLECFVVVGRAEAIRLSPTQFRLVRELARARGAFVPRSRLEAVLGQTGTTGPRALNELVRAVVKKLGEHGHCLQRQGNAFALYLDYGPAYDERFFDLREPRKPSPPPLLPLPGLGLDNAD